MIKAFTSKYYSAYSTARAGSIVARGVAKAEQTVNDRVFVTIGDNGQIVANGYVYISTDSQVPSSSESLMPVSRAVGGVGGLVAGTNVLSRLDATVNSTINTGKNAIVRSVTNDVTLLATGLIAGRVYSNIIFTVDGLSNIGTDAKSTNVINSIVTLGSGSTIQGVNVIIHGKVAKLDIYVEAYSETGSIINTQSRPWAYLHTTANGKVEGTFVSLIASNKLGIYGTVNNVRLRTYSYGYTMGATGSVVSTSENYVRVYGTVNIQNGTGTNVSELKGRDIEIIATSPTEEEAVYSKIAEYKADTVTEFVKKTITTVVKVVETVVEKVTKWLPWPLNKIVKWVTKQVVRFVTKVEEILVEVILQSETEAISKGDYKEGNNVTLNGNIYYGSNVLVTIIIDENGNISGVQVLNMLRTVFQGQLP